MSQLLRQMRMKSNILKMKKIKKVFGSLTLITALCLLFIGGCNKDDTPIHEISYDLQVEDVLGVTGKVTFTEFESGTTTIDVMLINSPVGTYATMLYSNTALEKGPTVLTLQPVDESGESSTIITMMNYNQLIAFDGHIKVLKSTDPDVILAICDIGGNAVTPNKKSYLLNTVDVYGVSGNALFEQRVNGNTLVTLTLTGMIAGETYPSTINLGSIASMGGGPVVKTLSNVNGTSGIGYTNIRKLDSDIDISYDNWLVYDGYINVYKTSVDLNNIISQGDIGSN